MTSAAEVARWMLEEFERQDGWLAQEDIALAIERRFGAAFVDDNDNGNLSITRSVLSAFRDLSAATIVWEQQERAWRRRESHDTPGKRSTH